MSKCAYSDCVFYINFVVSICFHNCLRPVYAVLLLPSYLPLLYPYDEQSDSQFIFTSINGFLCLDE